MKMRFFYTLAVSLALASAALLPVFAQEAPLPQATPSTQNTDRSIADAFPGSVFPGALNASPSSDAPLNFTEIVSRGASRHPVNSANVPLSPAASGLPVSPQQLLLTISGSEHIQGRVEARIATGRGLYYVVPTPTGAQFIPADRITGVAFADGRPFVLTPAASRVTAHATSAAANRDLLAYAHHYPGWTSGHGTRPAFPRGMLSYPHGSSYYSSSSGHWSRPATGGGFAAGPGDSSGHDYARAVGASNDPTLSTGWTSGHGDRTEHVSDYYRHTKSGRIVHVHSYYRRHR